ncbi:hypothetical protein [Jeongeupia chitinilytica]|uniref:Uncharacterized protein n=1 Tax=Jeongeupia chitinilytica TaxID=1041641 RepID=A0ABQ3H419_9NEIS|nr:hypothetical protein [Jeongeupia chitinilytica]GHD68469.1 hypothetical protein GCM10007350_33830 [Jeongeupia chitinilytica]
MDVADIIERVDEATVRKALSDLLAGYLNPVFGALPKGEVELLFLNALEQTGAIGTDPELYELVSKLRVTRAKARGLIYARELRRSSGDELDAKVKALLKKPLIQKDGEVFVLEVENPLVSDHLRAKVKQLGYLSDGSFSPSIVKLGLDAISALAEDSVADADKESLRLALVAAGAPDTSLKGIFKAALKKVASKVAADTGEALMDKVSDYMAPLIDASVDAILEKAGELFDGDD